MARPIVWPLVADPTRWNRGFDQAEQRGRRFQRHMQRSERDTVRFGTRIGKIGPLAVTAFGGAAVAAGGLAAAGAVLGLKTAANLETAEVAFSQLLGSAKRARSFLGELKTFAARTPFELPGLVDAARSLIGAGTAAKNVIPIMTALGDASGALGLDQERFGRVMTAVTQIMNRGKVQAEELNQITEAGIPVWTLLAKATGKPVPELQKLMASGKLLAKDVLPKLFDQMRKDYGGGMVKQSKTLAGIWSTFKDTISLTLSDALQPLLPMMKTALPKAAEAFQRSIKAIIDFFKLDLAPELGRVQFAWNQNKDAILGFVTSLTGATDGMGSSKDAAASLADGMERLIGILGTGAKKGTETGNVLDEFADQATDSGGATDRLRDALRFVIPGLAGMSLEAGFANEETKDLGTSTDLAAEAATRHAAALRDEKTALDAIKGAMQGEKAAELDLRQAKLNVQTAQNRLNELKRVGKTRSVDYKQAQIDLARAQLDLQRKTDAYKAAQQKANATTSGAAAVTGRTTPVIQRLGLAAQTGGQRAGAARVPWRKLGEEAAGAMARIHSKRARIIANFGWSGLQMFRVGPKGQTRVAFAQGGRVTQGTGPTADDVLARLSRGETVVSARDSAQPEFQAWAASRRIPGFAQGGTIPQFGMNGAGGFTRALGKWEDRVTRILDFGTRAIGRTLKALGGGNPAIKRFIASTDPLPYIWGGAGPGGYDCSGLVGAVYGKMTGRGGGHGQRYFTTSSISTGVPGLKPGLGGTLQIGVTPSRGHMAGRYGGLGFEAESTRTGIKVGAAASRPESFARHFHLARGGQIDARMLERFARVRDLDIGGDAGRLRINGKVLDDGGWLMPGQIGANLTRRPERVLGPSNTVELGPATIRALANELAKVIPTSVSVDAIHSGLKAKRNRTRLGLGLG
jgi:tape measure domain-containing protein